MSDFKLELNIDRVKAEINNAAVAFLHEAAGELEAQVKRNTKVDIGQLKDSWRYVVDESKLEAQVGSPLENAIWEEFGTGEYALNGNGRSGYWVFVKGSNGATKKSPKTYTLAEAKKVMAILRGKGLEAYYTKGKKPKRTFYLTYTKFKPKIKRLAQQKFGELNHD